MKQRFTILDIHAIVNELRGVLMNKFIQNIYSTSQRVVYFKMSTKDVLLVEPGARLHLTTSYDTEINHFCKKLREKCRHAKILDIYQYSYDRVVVIDISRYKIVFEFFSIGNIMILDENDIILEIHRPVENLQIVKGSKYIWNKIELRFTFDEFRASDLFQMMPFEREFIEKTMRRMVSHMLPAEDVGRDLNGDALDRCMNTLKNDNFRKEVEDFFRNLEKEIEEIGNFGEIKLKNRKPNEIFSFETDSNGLKLPELDGFSNEQNKKECLLDSSDMKIVELEDEEKITGSTAVDSGSFVNKEESDSEGRNLIGASVLKRVSELALRSTCDSSRSSNAIKLLSFDEVQSMIEKVTSGNKKITSLHFKSMNQAAEFFFHNRIKLSTSTKSNKSKIPKSDRIRKAQENYISELNLQAESIQGNIDVVEENKESVEEILQIFDSVYKNKVKWQTFDHFYKLEKSADNPVAKSIVHYDLKAKKGLFNVCDNLIEMKLNLSVNANIAEMYRSKKKLVDKSLKTYVAIENIVEKMRPKKVAVPLQNRVPYWFEKYHFFISSEGNLVIGGRNAQENDIIVKKHMDPTDTYFHCDVHGASSVICKGGSDETFKQASYMSLCMSKCWDEGIIKDVFYVSPDQVSKTAPSGEFLAKGGFVIKGKKNYLYPYKLEYGLGIVFKLEDSENILDFVSNPENSDNILHAMPMSGPWSLLQNYRYAVRLCPGSEKKQKIAQAIIEQFCKIAENRPEEKFVRSIGVQEYVNVLPGKSKIGKAFK